MKDGFGVYLWNVNGDTKIYLGFWKKGKQNGLGKYFNKKGARYGTWINGDRISWLNENEPIESYLKDDELNFLNYYNLSLKKIKSLLLENY